MNETRLPPESPAAEPIPALSLADRIGGLLRRDGSLSKRQRRIRNAKTREGLARARARGVVLGRPSGVTPEVLARIVKERETSSLQQIADRLNAEDIATAQGGIWRASTVKFVLDRENEGA